MIFSRMRSENYPTFHGGRLPLMKRLSPLSDSLDDTCLENKEIAST